MPFETLIAMYQGKPAARRLFDSIREEGIEDNRTTVDELIEGGEVSRRQAITLLRDLDEAGYGEFKVGRKGHPSRLEWSEDPRELAERLATGELDEPGVGAGAGTEAELELGFDPEQSPEQGGLIEPTLEGEEPPAADAPPRRGRSGARARREQVLEMFPGDREPEANGTVAEPPGGRRRRRGLEMIEHSYVLRRGLRIVVELPADLSAREAEVLGDWIRNLSFER